MTVLNRFFYYYFCENICFWVLKLCCLDPDSEYALLTVLGDSPVSIVHLHSLSDQSEEKAPDYDLAHVPQPVSDRGLDAVLQDLRHREGGQPTTIIFELLL